MITAEFDYQAAISIDEVIRLLHDGPEDVKIVAGGMSLVPMLGLGLLTPKTLIGLRQVPELNEVYELPDFLIVGSMVRHSKVVVDSLISGLAPLLSMAASLIGDGGRSGVACRPQQAGVFLSRNEEVARHENFLREGFGVVEGPGLGGSREVLSHQRGRAVRPQHPDESRYDSRTITVQGSAR